ncbi:MAG: hypothetical protein KKB13_15475 [Chloroflexi bacterium]|nr:hypothetical protein [Chloroflexota bacterium]
MRVNRFLFPLIVLAVFVLIVGGAMLLGFWQTKGGQGRGGGHEGDHSLVPTIGTVVQLGAAPSFQEVNREYA